MGFLIWRINARLYNNSAEEFLKVKKLLAVFTILRKYLQH